MGTALTCLDENSALDFLSGRLGPDALSQTERHLGTCAPCVELLARSAPFFPGVSPPVSQSLHGREPARRRRSSVSTLAMPAKNAARVPGTPASAPSATPAQSESQLGPEALAEDGVAGNSPATLAYGTVLKDTYTVMDLIGRGGMGEVYEVQHARLAGRYALKLLPPAFANEHVSVTRFRREADITSALRHPSIVQVIDFDHTPAGQPFLVMEYLDGGDLGQLMATTGAMPLPRVLKIVEQIVSALSAVHRKGIVHRDLKPQNVLLIRDDDLTQDRVKLVDFGLSKRSETTLLALGSSISRDQTLLGTPRYMAPEQASGRIDDIDATTDQFALAAMVYEMLTGTSAFDGDHMAMLLYRIVSEEPIPMGRFVPDLPAYVEAAVRRAMAKQRADRFASVTDFLEALSGNATTPGPAPRLQPAGRELAVAAATRAPISSSGASGPAPRTIAGEITVKTAARRRAVSLGFGLAAGLVLVVAWFVLRTAPISLSPSAAGVPLRNSPPAPAKPAEQTSPTTLAAPAAPVPHEDTAAPQAAMAPQRAPEAAATTPGGSVAVGTDSAAAPAPKAVREVGQTDSRRRAQADRGRRTARRQPAAPGAPDEKSTAVPAEPARTRDPGILVEQL
jgi:serine/threonine-protein kinase